MIEVQNVDYILTDIEGTTSDIAFVKNVLFPYSAREMRSFVGSNSSNPKVKECLKQADIEQLLKWIEDDVKHPALKTLQGMIWKKGYENGSYKAHMYTDVKQAFTKWQESGLPIGIYSSGSVDAQKLFYKYSVDGDLLSFISHHFDLDVGGKREVKSYQKIAEALKTKNVLFLSDIAEELDAAREAGFKTIQIVREGMIPPTKPTDRHSTAQNFNQIKIVNNK